ncbi:MAG TPA: magnesium transporter CorA family protein [Bryobacteraceae bacterium]|nr:magnesium transporter CorA family protein [Bryobacteraceae bacterium]
MDWHQVRDPQDPELDRLAEHYRLHPLHIEDCRHRNQSAKVEESRGYLFAVLKTVEIAGDGSLALADLDVFLGRDFIITVEEPGQHCARALLEAVRQADSRMRADQVFYRIVDGVVDSYLPVLDRFSEIIDDLEDRVLDRPSPETLARIFETKRNLIVLRRVLVNTRDVAGHLQRTETDLIQRDMWPFLRDVYDHVARNLDLVEMQRDLLTGSLDIYLSSVANRTNQVMKVLTVLGTIALPALVISGIYGMNLKGLPWADSPHGTAMVSGVMLATTMVLLAILRLFRWF